MNKKLVIIAVGFVVVIGLAFLAGQTGGIAIRRMSSQGEGVTMSLVNPVLPGVETSVKLAFPLGTPNTTVALYARDDKGENKIGEGRLSDGSIVAVFPCDLRGRQATAKLLDSRTGELLTSLQIELLPPGPDCI